jgi:pyrroline-5-carboxylate reductase
MGMIYAGAFLKYDIVKKENLLLVEKNAQRAAELMEMRSGLVVLANDERVAESDLILLAVKPQDFKELAHLLKPVLRPGCVVLSIMAGVTLSTLETALNHKNLVRAMPNAPAGLGMGVTAIYAHPAIDFKELKKAEHVLSTTGRTVFLDDESLMDAVTALSGSGPAYFYFIVKHMIEAGVNMGMDEGVAAMLVKQTMLGAFHMMNNSDKNLDSLITAVASKGGTTEAALSEFNKRDMGQILKDAIYKAQKRATELSA